MLTVFLEQGEREQELALSTPHINPVLQYLQEWCAKRKRKKNKRNNVLTASSKIPGIF